MYITRLASNEIFSPSNKIHWEVGRAKDLSAPRYIIQNLLFPEEKLCVGRHGIIFVNYCKKKKNKKKRTELLNNKCRGFM